MTMPDTLGQSSRTDRCIALAALMILLLWPPKITLAAFEAHGGPVKSVAVSADGRLALTASFDYSIIRRTIWANNYHVCVRNRFIRTASNHGNPIYRTIWTETRYHCAFYRIIRANKSYHGVRIRPDRLSGVRSEIHVWHRRVRDGRIVRPSGGERNHEQQPWRRVWN